MTGALLRYVVRKDPVIDVLVVTGRLATGVKLTLVMPCYKVDT